MPTEPNATTEVDVLGLSPPTNSVDPEDRTHLRPAAVGKYSFLIQKIGVCLFFGGKNYRNPCEELVYKPVLAAVGLQTIPLNCL